MCFIFTKEVKMDKLKERIKELELEVQLKQAKIDSLMLEYCPEEISKEQFDNWSKHKFQYLTVK